MPQYMIRKRLISIGGDFNVEDERGEIVYDVDRKVRFATTFVIKDRHGRKVISAKEKLLALDGTIVIERDGVTLATLRTVGGSTNPNRFEIEMPDGATITATGRFFQDVYTLTRDGQKFANVTLEQTVVGEGYRVNIANGEDDALVLAFVVSIAIMVPERGEGT